MVGIESLTVGNTSGVTLVSHVTHDNNYAKSMYAWDVEIVIYNHEKIIS